MRVAVVVLLALVARPALAADEIHWTILGPTAVSFQWRGPEAVIHYGLDPYVGSSTVAVAPAILPTSSPGPFWQARLVGLTPSTTYYYAIGDLPAPLHTFHTPPRPGPATFTFCAEADIGSHVYRVMVPVQQLIAQQDPSFCLMAGDLTYGDEKGPSYVDDHFNDVMVWSQQAAYMPAWGNHEWQVGAQTDPFANYKGRFELPHPQTSPGSPLAGGGDWYWFDYGNVRFIAYPEPWRGAIDDWFATAGTLMQQADDDPEIAAVVTFGHRPPHSTGSHGGLAALAAAVDSLGAHHPKYVLNISGHNHDYERTVPIAGVVNVVVGIGGAGLDTTAGSCEWAGGCPAPGWIAFRAFHHGALRVTVMPDHLEAIALCGPAGSNDDVDCTPGEPMDAFTIRFARPVLPAAARAPIIVQVRPSPARASSTLRFATRVPGRLQVELWDLAGRKAATLLDDPTSGAGDHDVPLARGGRTLVPGVYLWRVSAPEGRASGRIVIE